MANSRTTASSSTFLQGRAMPGVTRWYFLQALLFLSLNLSSFTTGDGQFAYYGFSTSNLTIDEAATILPGGLLELTNGMSNIQGHAFHPTPLRFRKLHNDTVQSFSVSFVFGIISSFPDVSAEGFTFFIAPSMDFSSALPAQYLGLLNNMYNIINIDHIFAVEIATVQNFEFHDINNNHVGIDINSLNSLKSYYAGYYDDHNGYFHNLTLFSGKAMQVWVDYDAEATQINVTMAPFKMAKPRRPLLSAIYNLSPVLTSEAYIGFSSATGAFSSRHYILGWSFSMNGPAPAFAQGSKMTMMLTRHP